MSAPSVRAAALAFALSSWAEGLTLVRTVLLTPYLPGSGFPVEQRVSQESSSSLPGNWKDRILGWLKRNGREMDDTERSLLALVDVSTALLLMQALDQPLPPFLLSPLLTSLPLPRSMGGFKPIKWHYVFLATVFLSMAHEAERAAVSSAVEFVRKLHETRNKNLLGEVFARGAEHYPTEDPDEEEDQQECLICAGVGPETSLSQSISSISSLATTSQANALGPLEAFCAIAPQKHVVHRSCFLTWHTAYRQQRIHLPPEQVELEDCKDEAERTRAASILDAAGFGHLSRHLRLPHKLSWTPSVSTPLPAHPTLTLISDAADSQSSSSTRSTLKYLAMLRTSIPPCPGCRSSVVIRFFSRPVVPKRNVQPPTHRERIKFIARLWMKHWSELVTGRTVLYRLVSQWSFVIALVSMMRVSGDRSRFRWTFI